MNLNAMRKSPLRFLILICSLHLIAIDMLRRFFVIKIFRSSEFFSLNLLEKFHNELKSNLKGTKSLFTHDTREMRTMLMTFSYEHKHTDTHLYISCEKVK